MGNNNQPQIIYIKEAKSPTNGLGTAGFVLSLIAMLLCWTYLVAWILWLLGFVFSFIALFKAPRGMAIAGFVISCVNLFILLFFVGLIVAMITEGVNY